MDFTNKKIVVAGLGSTGVATLNYLNSIGANVCGFDSGLDEEHFQQLRQRFANTAFFSGSIESVLTDCDVLVLSPGISKKLPEIRAFEASGGQVIGDVAILANLLKNSGTKIIAITGSNGKTTVTSLVGHLCTQSGLDTVVAGNIGTPVLDAWLNRQGKPADVWVLELSSFQLETTPELNAAAAVCLNISEDHLDRYDDLLDYARAKDAIFNGCGVQILNVDDYLCRAMKRANSSVQYFSLKEQSDYYLSNSNLCADNTILMPQSEVPLQGSHNMANVLAALAACEAIGIERKKLLPAVRTFKGLPHRVQKIGEKDGIVFIDDSKGTNVGATVAAITGLPEKIVLIAGGQGKGQDFTPLRSVLAEKARAVLIIGVDGKKIVKDLADCGVPLLFCETLTEAVQKGFALAQKGDIVLLSPACASFDMFNGYAHRAQVFIEAFEAL